MTQANIIKLTKASYKNNAEARKARWLLGEALVKEFYTKKNREWVTNRSLDAEAMTVSDFAKANHKKLGKSLDALKVFYSEAIAFYKKHKTLAKAMKETIKQTTETEASEFDPNASADNTINRLGEKDAVRLANAILKKAGKKTGK